MNKNKIREALEFYANGGHLQINDLEEWESPSGEGENWLCPPSDEAIAVENGGIAKDALAALDDDGWMVLDEQTKERRAGTMDFKIPPETERIRVTFYKQAPEES